MMIPGGKRSYLLNVGEETFVTGVIYMYGLKFKGLRKFS